MLTLLINTLAFEFKMKVDTFISGSHQTEWISFLIGQASCLQRPRLYISFYYVKVPEKHSGHFAQTTNEVNMRLLCGYHILAYIYIIKHFVDG